MARKTIDVETVKAAANKALSDPDTIANQVRYQGGELGAAAFRTGVTAVLEDVLMKTGNYKGFAFTDGDNGRTDSSQRRYF